MEGETREGKERRRRAKHTVEDVEDRSSGVESGGPSMLFSDGASMQMIDEACAALIIDAAIRGQLVDSTIRMGVHSFKKKKEKY